MTKSKPGGPRQFGPERYETDKLADDTIARILGPWPADSPEPPPAVMGNLSLLGRHFLAADLRNRDMHHRLAVPGLHDEGNEALNDFVSTASKLPFTKDKHRMKMARNLFWSNGPANGAVLLFGSFTESNAFPSVAVLLNASKRLEKLTPVRVRQTTDYVTAIMADGGFTDPNQNGIPGILKPRLGHAVARYLVGRGPIDEVMARVGPQGRVPPVTGQPPAKNQYEEMARAGWDFAENGAPCNLVEMPYVSMCFSKVGLDGMGKFNVYPSREQQLAYYELFANAGQMMGIRRSLLPSTPEQAHAMFAKAQAEDVAHKIPNDPRPGLTRALVDWAKSGLHGPILSRLPELLIRRLCTPETQEAMGLRRGLGGLPARTLKTMVPAQVLLNRAEAMGHKVGRDLLGLNIEQMRAREGRLDVRAETPLVVTGSSSPTPAHVHHHHDHGPKRTLSGGAFHHHAGIGHHPPVRSVEQDGADAVSGQFPDQKPF